MRSKVPRQRGVTTAAILFLAAALFAPLASAQTTTGTLRGTVKDQTGGVLPGATVEAINDDSGFRQAATTLTNGFFNISVSPGPYTVTATLPSFGAETKKVRVLLGQTQQVDFELTVTAKVSEQVTVSASAAVELRSSEVATNVTQQQIENLPQNSRNFINFVALAPGVRINDDVNDTKVFSSGGESARQVNVFIDGLSYKNDVLTGGAFMQDSSRGNPFPQNAVQEFRVLTQNYKAEYEKSAAAIISVVTKSGGNAWHGDAFLEYQNKNLVAKDEFSKERGDPKPDYKRYQGGVSVGGPLVKDRLHVFASYELNDQDRFNAVFFGSDINRAPADVVARFAGQSLGTVKAPFRSNLYFGKLSYSPTTNQSLDLSANFRDESERRSFGGQRTFEGAEDFQVKTSAIVLKHQYVFGSSLNEAALTYQQLKWNPTALNPDIPHQNYVGILDIGGKDSTQTFKQDRFGIRDDFTLPVNWKGSHVLKAGAGVNFMKYDVENRLNGNPTFTFRPDEQWEYPYKASYGFGDPHVSFRNTEFGVYLQDDWTPMSRLSVNVGVRWDYESNMLNNDFVTPPALVAALQSAQTTVDGTTYRLTDVLDLDKFTTDGNDRDPYYGMIQPRIGLSYDLVGNGRTIAYGGWGRYHDRVNLLDIYEEAHKQTWKTYDFCFSADGTPRPGCSTPPIMWNASYLSADALNQLIASGQAPGPEAWLLDNNTRPPRSDQFTFGLRQALGRWFVSLSYNNVRGYNGLTWFFGDRRLGATSQFGDNIPVPGYGRVLISDTHRRSWYQAGFLTIDKPFTPESNWGFNLAYTLAKAEQYGRENRIDSTQFGFDYITPENFTRVPGDNDERHRLILSGIVGLPWEFRASTLITLGSGLPFTIFDCSHGGCGNIQNRWNEGTPRRKSFIIPNAWAYRSVDLRLQKDFGIGIGRLGISLEAFNVFNYVNEGCYGFSEGFINENGVKDPKFGKGSCAINPRRGQVGLNFSF
jgi:outer membrane receptor for ferrienterochelin and colicin